MKLPNYLKLPLLALLPVVSSCDDWASVGTERCDKLMDSVEEIEGPPESVVSSGSDVIWNYNGFVYTFMASSDSCTVEFEERS